MGGPREGAAGQRAELREAAQAFEAVLLRQMLASARKTDFGGNDLFEGSDDTFTEMRDERFADLTAKSGQLGFADAIERQLERFLPAQPEPEDKG
ncbi:flagellar biosynthesis protein FlgJ [Citromicrobium sp. RCC1897]|nr:flagellar biosynthesis protein FlgJ [Citromicrobium sp. RCC1897]